MRLLTRPPAYTPPSPVIPPTHTWLHSNVIGRVVYQAASVSEHGPVLNSSEAAAADQPVIEGEVDVEELFAAGGGGDDNDDDQQDYEEEEEQEKHDEGDQRQQGAGDKAAAEGAGKAPDGRGTTGQPPPAGGPGKSS